MVDHRIFYITIKALACLMLFTFITAASSRVIQNQTSVFLPEASIPLETTNPLVKPVDVEMYHTFSFYLHNVQGGQSPSAQAITEIANSRIPFAKPNSAFVVNNNIPFLTLNSELGPQIYTMSPLRKLMFGTITVFDDDLTSGKDLESESIGKAQGFYVASSEDGHCQVIAFTAMFESGGYADSLSFFGVRRIGVLESHLAIMGGTGMYVNAKGYTIVKTLPSTNHDLTDGIETMLEFTIFVA